jgi:hypothetical protein
MSAFWPYAANIAITSNRDVRGISNLLERGVSHCIGSYGDIKSWNPRGYQRYIFDHTFYFLGIWHNGGNFYMRLALKEGISFRL